MNQILFDISDNPDLANRICTKLGSESGQIESRHFPDGELYQRVLSDVTGKQAIIFADLYQPDPQLFGLLSLGHNLREIGASNTVLVTPYLPYMRQDIRFHEGESITSRHFAKHLSLAFDHLITVDPHLHRYHSLDQIYTLKGQALSAQRVIADYLRSLQREMILIGPDEESEQWVAAVASAADLPFQILLKERRGDLDVSVSAPELSAYKACQPVLVDDIISSGRTMLSTLDQLDAASMPKAMIIGVHGLFAANAYPLLKDRAEVLTTNSVPHESNAIDLSDLLCNAISAIDCSLKQQ